MLLIKERFLCVHLDTSVREHSLLPPGTPSLLRTVIDEASQSGFSPFSLQEHHGRVFLDGELLHVGQDSSSSPPAFDFASRSVGS